MKRFLIETALVCEAYLLSTFARLTGRPRTAKLIWDGTMAELDRRIDAELKALRNAR